MYGGRGRRVPAKPPVRVKQREIHAEIGLVFASTAAPGPVYSPTMAHVIERDSWANAPDRWKGELQCGQFGANSCLIFNYQPTVGGGPRLHKHPYAEIFVIRSGTGLFTIGDQEIRATAGQILIVPPDTPHKFTNLGPGPLESTDIHENGHFITEWLE
jgi:mannose-6-phosphate isomerase-like protein (cupin superfamily)